MSTTYQGVIIVGNTTSHIQDVHGHETHDLEYIDILVEEYEMQVHATDSRDDFDIVGYTLPEELTISISAVNLICKLAKKFETVTNTKAKIFSCVNRY